MEADDDVRCVERVLGGDVDAFEEIVRRWQGPLVNLAFRFCRDPMRAAEMAHDAFLKAFRGLSRWRGDAKFSTWLYSVALNHYRSELRRTGPPLVPLDLVAERPAAERTDRVAEQRMQAERVRWEVATLPAKYREALTMYYLQELEVMEIAVALGIPEGTLKARLHRGREMLRERLAAFVEHEELGHG